MARTKQTPSLAEASSVWTDHRQLSANGSLKNRASQSEAISTDGAPAHGQLQETLESLKTRPSQAGVAELAICVIGIYGSFLTWAFLQERITTTKYGSAKAPEVFNFSIFLNTIQSTCAALVGYIYLLASSKSGSVRPAIFPTRGILPPLLLIAVTSSLASPFGYASLKHVGYITFILAKSCKLLPVMALHVGLFGKRYPLYKYAVVALVTSGVALFTLAHPSSTSRSKKSSTADPSKSTAWGLLLLSINLLFDGLTNTTQDHINSTFRPYSGSQMMCAQNLISTFLTTIYLLALPALAQSPLGPVLSLSSSSPAVQELSNALAFVTRHPNVGYDVLGFAACGAVGQVFIFYTLTKFSSLLLVTITVTRKMLTMLLSVVWFGHRLSGGQWVGVGLVFGGVGAEAVVARREKAAKTETKTNVNGTGNKEL